jgi:hypothetical protein
MGVPMPPKEQQMSNKKTIQIIIRREDLRKPRMPAIPTGGPMKSKRGKGSYKRNPKHKGDEDVDK